jgi:hypothetical protein
LSIILLDYSSLGFALALATIGNFDTRSKLEAGFTLALALFCFILDFLQTIELIDWGACFNGFDLAEKRLIVC